MLPNCTKALVSETAENEPIVIQFLPELTVSRFLTAYPSLKYKMTGNITIGSFKAIYGKFDRRLVQMLSYSNLVCFVNFFFTSTPCTN